tara:strand:- start:196 stop:1110 length:915 start_codon:yes stop_codon:yes gene_type:complete
VIKSNFLTIIFQKLLNSKDIRFFKGKFLYFVFFRIIRNFLDRDLIIKIYNFKVFGSPKKNKTSYFLLKKCEFGDYHELDTIKRISNKHNILFFDCGCNYGFYSFYVASLSKLNEVISVEASKNTSNEFLKNLKLNNFSNITFKNNAISDTDEKNISFNESDNDWESSQIHSNFKLAKTTKVNSLKIDTLIKKYNLIDYQVIIKLDIEGNEMNAIKGSLDLIQSKNPLIIIEFSKYIFDNKENIEYLNLFLLRYDYSIYDTNNMKQDLKNVMKKINNLNKRYKTIGNYYLIKNSSEILKDFLNYE